MIYWFNWTLIGLTNTGRHHSFNKYLFSAYFIPDILSWDKAGNEASSLWAYGTYSLLRILNSQTVLDTLAI